MNETKIAPPSLICHRLPENAFQVNQLYNVTWSTVHTISAQSSQKEIKRTKSEEKLRSYCPNHMYCANTVK